MGESSTTLAIVIVTWNVRELVLEAIRSAQEDLSKSQIQGSIWVTDNSSSDGTADMIRLHHPDVRLLEPGENLGFAAGNNYALRAMGFPESSDLPEYVLLLNPDTIVRAGAIRALIDGMKMVKAGLGGARLVYGDGTFQHSAFRFPGLTQLIIDLFPVPARFYESRLNGRYSPRLYSGQLPFDVDHPLGASLMVHRDVIREVGLLDEAFDLYCEEIDWAMRIKKAGWKAVCVPGAEVVHYGGQSTRQVKAQSIINLWTARLRLYRKHYGFLKTSAARLIIRAGMNRLIQQTARDSSQSEDIRTALVDAYREVIRRSRV